MANIKFNVTDYDIIKKSEKLKQVYVFLKTTDVTAILKK